ncbi:unnamed protein product [Eruca vesicaria subsp. sativa]|uniref:Bifunctional inhibitor/plant lipid transfer protein/seed storage helical domain-containing protein n=1 Tax=Eruca vesicaria subsp. sativa TaxID=29727 RepID=A0ABC8M7K7_ERUVS|nr:unnamed protein product [Eruca vesicaria subsp. sativa]
MEPNTKLVVITLVLALTLTAATAQFCGMSVAGLYSCKPYVQTKNPLTTPIDREGPCCKALKNADDQCLCKQKTKTNPFLSGIDFDLASKLPEMCGLSKIYCKTKLLLKFLPLLELSNGSSKVWALPSGFFPRPWSEGPSPPPLLAGNLIPSSYVSSGQLTFDGDASVGVCRGIYRWLLISLKLSTFPYTSCADPSESAARKERLRHAEAQGELEEAAAVVVRSSSATARFEEQPSASPDIGSMPRAPIASRLGSLPRKGTDFASSSRVPALARLGPLMDEVTADDSVTASDTIPPKQKRKPGRPPGRKTVHASPLKLVNATPRRRKVHSTKQPPDRKLPTGLEQRDRVAKKCPALIIFRFAT